MFSEIYDHIPRATVTVEEVDCFLQKDKNTFLGSKKQKFEVLNVNAEANLDQ